MIRLPNESIDIPLDKIDISTTQARQRDTKVEDDDDLVSSIRKFGLISPIIVKQLPDDRYELLIGQRRFRAHEILNMPTIKSYVVEGYIDELEAKRMSLIENAARKDMTRADYVDTIDIFMNKYGSVKTVAEELGLSAGTVRKYVTIGRLPEKVQSMVKEKIVPIDVAIKAFDSLGGDVAKVDEKILEETVLEMRDLPVQARAKFIEIKKREPDTKASDVAKKAKERTVTHKITLDFTEDQYSRIDRFMGNEDISDTHDAASILIDKGLDAADV